MSRRLVTLFVVLTAVLAACSGSADRRAGDDIVEHATQQDFFKLPSPFPPGAPGTLIRQERLLGAPNGAIAWRIMYHSRDVLGHDVGVTGIVIAPTGPAPKNGRAVVAWAHPTTGSVPKCGPSRGLDPFVLIEGLKDLLADGYVVAATDYPGMGADGPPSYLIGTTEGNSVLDSVRAARAISDAHANTNVLLWGHSQGGHAALFAARDARAYAPELQVAGVAVAAPAVELGALLKDDIGDDSGVKLGAYAFDAYQRVYAPNDRGATYAKILTPAGAAATPKLASYCLFNFGFTNEAKKIATPLVGRYLSHSPAAVEPWKSWLATNTPAATGMTLPMFVAQGTKDELVHPQTTDAYVAKLCAAHADVAYDHVNNTGHGLVALRALPRVRAFFRDTLAGRAIASTC